MSNEFDYSIRNVLKYYDYFIPPIIFPVQIVFNESLREFTGVIYFNGVIICC